MRHITALDLEKVPKDDEFKFRERAKAPADKWHQILGPSPATKSTTNGGGDPATGEAKPVNGDAVTKDVSMMDIPAVNGDSDPEGESKTEATPPAAEGDNAGDMSVLADVTVSNMAD
ncbi:hypothetical protein VKT23_020590 [Stygiomarasmius scandens]|uniref:Uncharacterized protein n=1 Tax=Marasmiellus scandens TaxID=2682957 RepID=A0ABR1IJ03_9AGAR